MKRNWRNRSDLSILFLLLALLTSCNTSVDHSDHADTYTCPMHPTVISDKPGTCPVCGMELVRKARPGEEVEITEDLSKLLKSPNETVLASIETIKGQYKQMPVSFEAQGVVTYDTRKIYTIPARVGGRLERVFLKYPFQHITKGQKVAEIYSPELVTAQREFLFLLENDPENESLITGAKQRLSLLGATQSQIDHLTRTKEAQSMFIIYSPYDGYILSESQEKPVAPLYSRATSAQAGGMSDGMEAPSSLSNSNPSSSPSSNAETLIREGSYVTAGQTLFKVVNTSALRIELNVPSSLAGSIEKGAEVSLDFGNGEYDRARIDLVQPFFNEGEEFLTLRVFTQNTEKLHIGHLVKAKLESKSVEALWVPKDAVLDLGVDKIVFVKDKNVLETKKVIVGARSENWIEIKQGLSSSDEIAANAQYLIDSESFIKTQK
jgi:membrane fusion protein, copper/silver efflux system